MSASTPEAPRITQAHTSEEAEGGLLGIPIRVLLWLMPLMTVAGLVFLFQARRVGIMPAALRTLVPAFIVYFIVRGFLGGSPIGFILDRWLSTLFSANASPATRSTHPANRILTPLPDGYVDEGLIVFGGLQGQVSAGFWIDLPDLRNASAAERNRTQDTWCAIWRQLPEDWFCQLLALEDNSLLQPQLLKYAEATKASTIPIVRKFRDANFVHLWHQLEAGNLRRRRLLLFVGHTTPSGLTDPSTQLSVTQKGIRDWAITIQHLLERGGGRMYPLESKDILRLWAETLNPSIRWERGYDPAAHYAPHCSLLDNFWSSEFKESRDGGFVLDGVHHLALSMKRLPSESFPGISQHLTLLNFPWMTLCLQTRRLAKEQILTRAQTKLERIHRQQLEKPNPRLAVSQQQLETKIQRLAAQGVVPMEAELIVLVRAQTASELQARAASVKEAIHRMQGAQSFEASLPRSSQSLFSKCLPGWMWSAHRGYHHYLEDPTTSDLVPWVSSFSGYPGPTESLFPGADGGLVNIVTSLGTGQESTPQHMVVLGSTGAGKSKVVTKLLIESADAIAFAAIVESGLSQVEFTRAHQAEPLCFKLNGTQTINFVSTHGRPRCPFYLKSTAAILARMVGIPNDEDQARRQHALICRELQRTTSDHAEDCLRRFDSKRKEALLRQGVAIQRRMHAGNQSFVDAFDDFQLNLADDPEGTALELSRIDALELQAYEADPESHLQDLLFSALSEREQLTLSSLQEALQLAEEEECRWLSVLLQPFCRGNAYGSVFDGPTNVSLSQSVIHFELGSIPEAARDLESILGFAAINQIRARCLNLPRRLRKRVVIDEVSRFLAFPGGEEIVREMFEGFRKYGTQVIIIGQQYGRLADTRIKKAIVGNASAWLIFNTGDLQDVERLATDLELTPLARESISRFARPDPLSGQKYSEFLYVHSLGGQRICGCVRYFMIQA